MQEMRLKMRKLPSRDLRMPRPYLGCRDSRRWDCLVTILRGRPSAAIAEGRHTRLAKINAMKRRCSPCLGRIGAEIAQAR